MKKIVLAISVSISLLACSKDDDAPVYTEPLIENFTVESDSSGGTKRPRIKFNAIVPNPQQVIVLYITRLHEPTPFNYKIDSVQTVKKPVTQVYSIIDTTTTYPYNGYSTYLFSFISETGVKAFRVEN